MMGDQLPTPGEWFTFANGHCVGGPHPENVTAGIAMCSMGLRSAAENAANARLIAAAPNLLAALVAMLEDAAPMASLQAVLETKIEFLVRIPVDRLIAARAAIAKATGGTT